MIYVKYFLVGYQRERPLVIVSHFSSEHKRRTEDAPKRHKGNLLVLGKLRVSVLRTVTGAVYRNIAKRQHIAVGPTALADIRIPFFGLFKHFIELVPNVPKVARHTPHICVFHKVVGNLNLCRSGRKAQHHISAAGVYRTSYHFNFFPCGIRLIGLELRVCNIVNLDEIDTPFGIELEKRIIVFLRSLYPCIHAVHIRIPRANRKMMCNLPCGYIRV